MHWKRTVNDVLARTTGYELRRRDAPRSRLGAAPGISPLSQPRAGDRLVDAPVFILCTMRSGSTLLRVLLNSHSHIHAPHETHLYDVSVQLDRKWSKRAMKEMGLDAGRLEYLLWDRLLHRELAGSGKHVIVEKTPNNVFIADRLHECWPDARFIFLLRHPAAVARSRGAYRSDDDDNNENSKFILRYCSALERARRAYDGLTVRYEELTADPEVETRRICEFLDLEWEASMLDYGRFDHGRYRAGLGDWAEKIKTGRIQPPDPPPDHIPEPLREVCAIWGYLPSASPP